MSDNQTNTNNMKNKELLADMSESAYQYAQDNSIEEMDQDAVGVYNKFISYDNQNKE